MAQAIYRKKRGARARHWCFTSYLEELPTPFDKDIIRYLIMQREVSPETKRQHWQGYVEFFSDMRLGQVKAVLGECHAEPRRGTRNEARTYCRKESSAVPDTLIEFGFWRVKPSNKRKLCEVLESEESLDEIIANNPAMYVRWHRGLDKLFARRYSKKAKVFRAVEVLVFIGKTGTGKTRRAVEEPDHYFLPCSSGRQWFDGYSGQKCLIIDDFYGNIKYSQLLRLLDGYEYQCEIKGGFVWAEWTKVIITSNAQPCDWYQMFNHQIPGALNRRITEIINL